jgi:DNA-binding response OmpR family regulator
VTDNVGGGTVFIITIPIVHVSTAAEEEAAETETEAVDTNELNQPDNTGHKYTALVVDDDEALLSFMYDELSESYTVLKARDGVEALEVMETNKPDIVVSDIMMPRMDGIELCRHIKSDRDTSIIPLILLSSKYSLDTKVEGLEAGADDYITKPFNMDVLKLRIKKMIELRHNDSGLIEVEPSPVKITSKDEEMVDYAIKYVEENIQNPELSVDDLLSNASSGLSKANFYKRLRNVTGKTPTEFIRTIRLKRAMQLLKESEMNISEVAYQVGYNNPRYFSLQFKEEFKVSPSDIIKKRD